MQIEGIAHKNLTDPQLHEPKGASSASLNQVPFADGEGGTSWQSITPDKLDITPTEQNAVSAEVLVPVAPLDTTGLSGTPSDTMSPAINWTGANQNTLNESAKINEILTRLATIESAYLNLAGSYNNLLEALKDLGLITVVYPR